MDGLLNICPQCCRRTATARGLQIHMKSCRVALQNNPPENTGIDGDWSRFSRISQSGRQPTQHPPSPFVDEDTDDSGDDDDSDRAVDPGHPVESLGQLLDFASLPLPNDHISVSIAPSSSQGRRLLLQTTKTILYTDKFAQSPSHPRAGRPVGSMLTTTPSYSHHPLDQLCQLLDNGETPGITDDSYSPFSNRMQFGLATHYREFGTSQAELNSLLRNRDISFMSPMDEIRNAKDFFDMVDRIPYGIADDEWHVHTIAVDSEDSDAPPTKYTVFSRDIEKSIRFLLGYRPFEPYTKYVPVQEFDERGERLFSDFMTADLAWKLQDRLDDGATLVALKVYSDKTLLTNIVGEQAFYPVGIQLLNHSTELLNRTDVPNYVTVGFLPVLTASERRPIVKAELYHLSMSKIFDPLIPLASTGIPMLCADGLYRHCHPIIAGISADYEEQTLITGIKKNRQCPVCTVSFDQMEVLYGSVWPSRSHEHTVKLHQNQQAVRTKKSNTTSRNSQQLADPAGRVNHQYNYLWAHPYSDAHEIIMPDILHQLDKGIVNNVIQWLQIPEPVDFEPHASDPIRRRPRGIHQQFLTRLNRQFQAVPPFTGLRTFSDFTGITKWQGTFQRAVLRQLSAVLSGLFRSSRPARVVFVNALTNIDFIVRSKIISESMLYYLKDDLYILNLTKNAWDYAREPRNLKYRHQHQGKNTLTRVTKSTNNFRHTVARTKPQTQSESESHFESNSDTESHSDEDDAEIQSATYNIPKWHMLTHYTDWIRTKGSPQIGNTSRGEVEHKQIKSFYRRTNKHGDWIEQMCHHMTRSHRILAMTAYRDWLQDRIAPTLKPSADPSMNITAASSELVDLNKMKVPFTLPSPDGLPPRYWRRPICVENMLGVQNLERIIATLLRNERARMNGKQLSNHLLDRLVPLSSMTTNDVWIALHGSITCYRAAAQSAARVGEEVKELVYCSYRWRNQEGKVRRDTVWVQDYPDTSVDAETQSFQRNDVGGSIAPTITASQTTYKSNRSRSQITALQGRKIGRLVAIVTAVEARSDSYAGKPTKYQGAILEMFSFVGREAYNSIDRLVHLEMPNSPRYQVFPLDSIVRSAHVVPLLTTKPDPIGSQSFVVNYASDWDSWMTLAPDDFLDINVRVATKLFHDMNQQRQKEGRRLIPLPKYDRPPKWVVDASVPPPTLFTQITSEFPVHT